MDGGQFDDLTRAVSTVMSRRGVVRRMALAGIGVGLSGLLGHQNSGSAHHCNYEGCGCSTGTQHACGSGLVCCASNPGTSGGGGVCTTRGQCGGGCVDRGNACPSYCNWGDGCSGC